MIYLTYNDAPSGIYFSQVTDVCNFLNERLDAKIRLVALISVRKYWENRKKIKSQFKKAIVIPMIPTIGLWRWNILSVFFLLLLINTKKAIARGPFAAVLCLMAKKTGMLNKVIFDARGASAAEVNEYEVIKNKHIKKKIFSIESRAVNESDFRMAVSNKLVEYWRNEFGYDKTGHLVIPCTLHKEFLKELPSEHELKLLKKRLGIEEDKIVLTFSGSSSQWHSFSMVDDFLCKVLTSNPNSRVLLLADEKINLKCLKSFPDRVIRIWLPHEEVRDTLLVADYGILLREKSVTNKVASPVKFAEYLSCGLKILISDEIGDFTRFVLDHDSGFIINDFLKAPMISKIEFQEKEKMNRLALAYFSKQHFMGNYNVLLNL